MFHSCDCGKFKLLLYVVGLSDVLVICFSLFGAAKIEGIANSHGQKCAQIGIKLGRKPFLYDFRPNLNHSYPLFAFNFSSKHFLPIVCRCHSELFLKAGSEILAVAIAQRNGNLCDVAILVLQPQLSLAHFLYADEIERRFARHTLQLSAQGGLGDIHGCCQFLHTEV